MIDPYNLLGVTTESTPTEVRKAYYELALVAHPDKGGSADQMRVVHCAYEWVLRQVEAVNRTVTYEQLEEDFLNFCKAQEAVRPPQFVDIHADIHNLPKFSDMFAERAAADTSQVDAAFAGGGYGEHMARSEYSSSTEVRDTEAPSGASRVSYTYYDPEGVRDSPVPPLGNAVVTVYVEPQPRHQTAEVVYRDVLDPHAKIDNFTIEFGGLLGTDYRAAFEEGNGTGEGSNRPELDLTDDALANLMKARRDAVSTSTYFL